MTQLLVKRAPAGYEPVTAASGALDLDQAAQATTLAPMRARLRLVESGFEGAASRVWDAGDRFRSVLVFEFDEADGARRFVASVVDELVGSTGTTTFEAGAIPGATGYILTGELRADSTTTFCHGVWFSVDEIASAATVCAGRPSSTGEVMALAEEQYKQLVGGEDSDSGTS